jgi:hypothetical protein
MTSATPKPRAGEHTQDADPGEPDEAWMHAACLTIAETGRKWGESVHPSPAMQAVFKLRTERDSLAAQNRELREALASIDQLMMSMPLTSKIEHQVHGIAHRALTKARPAS